MLEANAFRLGLRVRVSGYTFQNFKRLDDSEGGMCTKKLLCSQRDFKLWGQEVDCGCSWSTVVGTTIPYLWVDSVSFWNMTHSNSDGLDFRWKV